MQVKIIGVGKYILCEVVTSEELVQKNELFRAWN